MKSLRHLNKYLLKYKWRLLLGILCITISNLFAVFPAQIIRKSFDMVNDSLTLFHQSASGDPELQAILYSKLLWALFFFALIVFGFALGRGIFLFFMRQTLIVTSRLIEYDLKNEIFEHYQRLTPSFYNMQNTGDLMNRISEDVSRVRMYLGPGIMYTVNLLILFLIVVTIMFTVNVELSLYVLLPLPVLITGIYYVSNIINKKSDAVQEQLSRLSTLSQETFSGIRVIRAFGMEGLLSSEFAKESDVYKKKSLGLVRINSIFHPLVMLLISISTLLTISIGGLHAIDGKITAGNIAEFVFYVNMLTWPVASVGWVTSLVQRAAASQQRINEFLRIIPELHSPSNEIPSIHPASIEFNNVSFTYRDSGIRALSTISFKVNAGKSLAIVGRTGSGKSSIANLLCRMYDPDSGEIRISGKGITDMPVKQLRAMIGYVPQDAFLFSDTLFNNILFGSPTNPSGIENRYLSDGLAPPEGYVKAMVEQAARDAGIHKEIMGFPDGFETITGERGITLSGGQKQRIAIARAIIRSPAILIFDDCLSAVDTETEKLILQSLKRIMQNKTTIIISHRISSVLNADEIIVLEKGMIIEKGNHADLIEKEGVYYELHRKQLLEEEFEMTNDG